MTIKRWIRIWLVAMFLFIPQSSLAQSQVEYYRAKVLTTEDFVKESEFETEFKDFQKVNIQILNGNLKGKTYSFENNSSVFEKNDFYLKPNNQIIVTYQKVDNKEIVAMADFVRTVPIIFLLAVFGILLLVIAGWKGLRSIAGFLWIVIVFIFFLVPRIIAGSNIYVLVFVAALAIVTGSSLLLLGWSRKTLLILLSSLFGLIISTILVLVVGSWAHFSQIGLEESHLFHVSNVLKDLDLVGIMYAGMIIGALGSMMDISISIVAGIEEMLGASQEKGDRKVDQKRMFDSGLNIGRSIMAVNANTLILAYAGSALTVWVVAISQGYSWLLLSNFNMIFVEVLRIMSGTIGIFAAIPMTAYLASKFLVFERKKNYINLNK